MPVKEYVAKAHQATNKASANTGIASRRGTLITAAIVCLMLAIFIWIFPAVILLTLATVRADSLLLGLLGVFLLLLPLYVWGVVMLVHKIGLTLPATRWIRAGIITIFTISCYVVPFGVLQTLYAFEIPLSKRVYSYDSCAITNGISASNIDDPRTFSCIDAHGNRLNP